MRKFWALFFIFWPIVAVALFCMAPSMGWWFPGDAMTPLGQQIDDLFYLILVITGAVFILTQAALGYVLWRSATEQDETAWFTHGSHNLEVVWTIVPAGILLFIALYQMDVWAQYRVQANFPEEAREAPIAEITARQFEWRIRYPAPGKTLQLEPQPDDIYTVNDLHVPTGRPVMVQLRSGDVQHSFFVPDLRVKQDAVPGLVIPIWFEVTQPGSYDLTCAELCGWGHYKMQGRVLAQPEDEFQAYLRRLQREQSDDGVPETQATDAAVQNQ